MRKYDIHCSMIALYHSLIPSMKYGYHSDNVGTGNVRTRVVGFSQLVAKRLRGSAYRFAWNRGQGRGPKEVVL